MVQVPALTLVLDLVDCTTCGSASRGAVALGEISRNDYTEFGGQ